MDHFQDKETVDDLLVNLRVLFITHVHGDHHIGTSNLLHKRSDAISSRYSEQYIIENKEDLEIFVIIP